MSAKHVIILAVAVASIAGCAAQASDANRPHAPSVPVAYADEPACQVKSIQKYPVIFENIGKSPASDLYEINKKDKDGVYQVYVGKAGDNNPQCISCTAHPGAPRPDKHKVMVAWHPSGQWLTVGVEKDSHDLMWVPHSWQEGWLQSGIWLNIWATTPAGDRWYQLTDFKPENGKSDGFTGIAFTPDGRKAVWAEIVDGNIFVNSFGKWRLYMADFVVDANGVPSLANKKDITPAGANWVEPGNFSPDGKHILLSTDIGIPDAQGQDQWILDVTTGGLQQLTKTPTVWDEHGVFSPSGRKIVFMSSYPYRDEPNSYKTLHLKTEFMLIGADGSHLQQLTHFNVPGYAESQPERTIAAVAGFMGDGSQMMATMMGPDFTKVAWIITFQGKCGSN